MSTKIMSKAENRTERRPTVDELRAKVEAEEKAEKEKLAAQSADKRKPSRSKRVAYPGSVTSDTEGNKVYTKYDAIPADFNPKIHKPLKRKNFKDEASYLEIKANYLETKIAKTQARIASLRDEARILRLDPHAAEKAKLASKKAKLLAKIAELEKLLGKDAVAGA